MISPREPVRDLTPTLHGGIQTHDLERLGLRRDQLLDFSVGTNPYPPPSSVVEAARSVPIEAYPDSRARRLQEALAALLGLDSRQISVVNGTSQALWLIALAFLRPGDEVLTFPPTYGDYRTVSTIMGARTTELRTRSEDEFVPDLEVASRLIRERPVRVIWLCNPNNPTSTYLSREELEPLLETCRQQDTLLVLDEAYASFSPKRFSTEELIDRYPLLLMRSMTKDFNLNALRLGYIAASAGIAEIIDRVQPPWSVNTPAEEAGLMALQELDYYRRSWKKTAELTESLGVAIEKIGFKRYPVGCNFQLFEGPLELDLAEKLWKRGIKIRDCSSFGLPGFFRIGTSGRSDNDRLTAAIAEIYSMSSNSPR
ncbi:MAG: pyridoxal phosphate-dependent aminotransferase [Alkalispirochaetaceae bacterium]